MFVVTGLGLSTLGVFILPISMTFRLSSTEMFLLTVITLVGFCAAGSLVGWLMGKTSARLVLSISTTAAAAGYVLASFAGSFGMFGFLLAVASIGVGASTMVPCMILAKRWFRDHFSFAMGWIVAAYALGGAVMPPIIANLVTRVGWQLAMRGSGVVILVTALPIILFLIGDCPGGVAAALLSQRLRTSSQIYWAFWSITALLTVAQLGINGAYYAFIPFGADLHYSLNASGTMLGVINACSAAGCLVAGALADRLGVRWVLFVSLAANAICMALPAWAFAHVPNQLLVVALAVTFGIVRILPSQLIPVLLADAVGEQAFGTLSGSMMLIAGIVSAVSPLAVGYIHDRTDTYVPALLGCAACMLLSTPFLILSGGDKREVTGRQEEATE